MGTFIKKNSGFLYWVLIPSLLLVASVFGVNFVSMPVVSFYGSINCQSDSECNAEKNPCVQEICNSTDPSGFQGFCDIVGYGTPVQCGTCNTCGNGRCEEIVAEDSITCSLDCLKGNGGTGLVDAPVCTPGVACGAELVISNTIVTSTPPPLDGCCPANCQGANSTDTLTFDADCLPPCCGDGVLDTLGGEICDNATTPDGCLAGQTCNGACQCQSDCGNGVLDTGEECDPLLTGQPNMGCPIAGQTCNAQCQCSSICGDGTIDPGEDCEPPNTATCDANCQSTLPVCGNGLVEAGEDCEGPTCTATIDGEVFPGVCDACQCFPECQTEGSGCGDDGTGAPGVCFAGTGGTGGGSSLIPLGVRTGVLAQWLAAFAVPGMAFVGLRMRKRSKK